MICLACASPKLCLDLFYVVLHGISLACACPYKDSTRIFYACVVLCMICLAFGVAYHDFDWICSACVVLYRICSAFAAHCKGVD